MQSKHAVVLGVSFAVLTTACVTAQINRRVSKNAILGKYYFGDGEGMNCFLELNENSEFDFKWRGCLGLYDQNCGKYAFDGEKLSLIPILPNKREGFRGTDTEFIVVPWGDRMYLVPEKKMLNFIAQSRIANDSFFLQRNPSFYLKADQDAKSQEYRQVSGSPSLPSRYQKYLHMDLSLRITELGKSGLVWAQAKSDVSIPCGTEYSAQDGFYYPQLEVQSCSGSQVCLKAGDAKQKPFKGQKYTLSPF